MIDRAAKPQRIAIGWRWRTFSKVYRQLVRRFAGVRPHLVAVALETGNRLVSMTRNVA